MNDNGECEQCGQFRVHPSAAKLPLMTGDAWTDFKEAIRKAGGNVEPVVVQGDLLIDGRNRVRAIQELQAEGHPVELLTKDWAGDGQETVTEFILRANVSRRHLTSDQMAAIALELLPRIQAERASRQQASRIQPGENRNPHGRKGKPETADANSPSPSTEERRERIRRKAANSTLGQLAKTARVTEYKLKQVKKAIETGGPGTKDQLLKGEVTAKEINRKSPKPKDAPDPHLPMQFQPFVKKNYRTLLAKHPVTDQAAVRKYLLRLIRDEQAKYGEVKNAKRFVLSAASGKAATATGVAS
jgi:hypothetical protein